MTKKQPPSIPDLIRAAWERDEPAGWFEPLYASAARGEGHVPWAAMEAYTPFAEWVEKHQPSGTGKRCLVIGCGLGDEAELLASLGFMVTAFDISESAIAWAKQRFPDTKVTYLVHDLFKTPAEWRQAFDFVLEMRTIQALPNTLAEKTTAQIASFVAVTGELLVICNGRDPHESKQGIPWRLSLEDLHLFTKQGLKQIQVEDLSHYGYRILRALYGRDAATSA